MTSTSVVSCKRRVLGKPVTGSESHHIHKLSAGGGKSPETSFSRLQVQNQIVPKLRSVTVLIPNTAHTHMLGGAGSRGLCVGVVMLVGC